MQARHPDSCWPQARLAVHRSGGPRAHPVRLTAADFEDLRAPPSLQDCQAPTWRTWAMSGAVTVRFGEPSIYRMVTEPRGRGW